MTKYAHEIFGSEAGQIPDRPTSTTTSTSNKLRLHKREMSPRQEEVHDDNGEDDKAGNFYLPIILCMK